MKKYPLNIQPVQEFQAGSKPLWYMSKGHHSFEEFCDALREWDVYAERYAIRHTYWRYLPDGSSIESKAGRGAVPVTVLDMEHPTAKIIVPQKVSLQKLLAKQNN